MAPPDHASLIVLTRAFREHIVLHCAVDNSRIAAAAPAPEMGAQRSARSTGRCSGCSAFGPLGVRCSILPSTRLRNDHAVS